MRRFILTRFIHYYRSNGIWRTFTRIMLKVKEIFTWDTYQLFYVNLCDTQDEFTPIDNEYSIECYCEKQLVPDSVYSRYREQFNAKITEQNYDQRFHRGAWLWTIHNKDQFFGFVWSICGKTMDSYFFPLLSRDVHLFDNYIFTEYRGKGINSFLLSGVLQRLKDYDCDRVLFETKTTNASELRSFSRLKFTQLCKARKTVFGKYNVIIWQ